MANPAPPRSSPASLTANPASALDRTKGAELSESARMGMAVRIAMAVPPGQSSLPRGIGAALANEYGVSNKYPSKLWGKVSDQLAAGLTLDLGRKTRDGRPSTRTPAKKKRTVDSIEEHRSVTLQQLKVELKSENIVVSTAQLKRWVQSMRGTSETQVQHKHPKQRGKRRGLDSPARGGGRGTALVGGAAASAASQRASFVSPGHKVPRLSSPHPVGKEATQEAQKKPRGRQHCARCGHLRQHGPYVKYHTPSLPPSCTGGWGDASSSVRGGGVEEAKESRGPGGEKQEQKTDREESQKYKCWCPKPYRRLPVRSSGNGKLRFGGECTCTGDERHPGGCAQVQQV